MYRYRYSIVALFEREGHPVGVWCRLPVLVAVSLSLVYFFSVGSVLAGKGLHDGLTDPSLFGSWVL